MATLHLLHFVPSWIILNNLWVTNSQLTCFCEFWLFSHVPFPCYIFVQYFMPFKAEVPVSTNCNTSLCHYRKLEQYMVTSWKHLLITMYMSSTLTPSDILTEALNGKVFLLRSFFHSFCVYYMWILPYWSQQYPCDFLWYVTILKNK